MAPARLHPYNLRFAFINAGIFAEHAGRPDDALNNYQDAFAIGTDSEQRNLIDGDSRFLHKQIPLLVHRLGKNGRPEQKERSRHFSQRIRHYLVGSELEPFTDPFSPGLATLGRLFRRETLKKMASHENQDFRLWHESIVVDWLLMSVDQRSPFRSSSCAVTFDRDREAGAAALIAAVREPCTKLGLPESLVPATIRALIEDAVSEAADHRRLGRLDDARATTTRLLALGRQIVREYPDSADAYRVLSEVYEQHGQTLVSLGKSEDARESMNSALRDLEQRLAKRPEDADARHDFRHSLVQSAQFNEIAGHLEDALIDYERASAIRTDLERSSLTWGDTIHLYQKAQAITHRLGQGGQTGQKNRSRLLNQQIVRNLVGSAVEFPAGASVPEFETIGRFFERDDLRREISRGNKDLGLRRDEIVAEWLAISVNSVSPFRPSSTAAKTDRQPEAEASAVISALREQCSKFHIAQSLVPAAINSLATDANLGAAEQRKLGRLDDARATAARLMSLAKELVREYPESGHAYRVLSEAYNQRRKNAIKAGDKKLEEVSIVQAIEAAQRALGLGIGGADGAGTRRHLDGLTERFADLNAARRAAVPAAP